jgi:predicted CoA-binding protein
MRSADGFVLIGDSSEERFPAESFNAYTLADKRFYCIDLGGLTQSRGKSAGRKVYGSAEELPDDHGDLAIVWTKPRTATRAVEVAHAAGCKRVWFSFQTGHRDAVARAGELGMQVVEIGRCPAYYMSNQPMGCRAHTALVKMSGTYRRPPQLDPDVKHREIW